MTTTYQLNVAALVSSNNSIHQQLEQLHQSFKYNMRPGHGYINLTEVNETTVDLFFSKEVDQVIIDAINKILTTYTSALFETLKNKKIEEIDAKTGKLIHQGATFDNRLFSLSDNAQRNWIATKASIDVYTALNAFPVPITTLDDDVYLLHNAQHIVQFTTTMLCAVANHYNSGRNLKIQVKAARNVAELAAIVDLRK